jgi:hypothetical protein
MKKHGLVAAIIVMTTLIDMILVSRGGDSAYTDSLS